MTKCKEEGRNFMSLENGTEVNGGKERIVIDLQ